jgi:hypothetical protein
MRWQLQQSCRMRRSGLYLLGSVSRSHVSSRWRDLETCAHPANYSSEQIVILSSVVCGSKEARMRPWTDNGGEQHSLTSKFVGMGWP